MAHMVAFLVGETSPLPGAQVLRLGGYVIQHDGRRGRGVTNPQHAVLDGICGCYGSL